MKLIQASWAMTLELTGEGYDKVENE